MIMSEYRRKRAEIKAEKEREAKEHCVHCRILDKAGVEASDPKIPACVEYMLAPTRRKIHASRTMGLEVRWKEPSIKKFEKQKRKAQWEVERAIARRDKIEQKGVFSGEAQREVERAITRRDKIEQAIDLYNKQNEALQKYDDALKEHLRLFEDFLKGNDCPE